MSPRLASKLNGANKSARSLLEGAKRSATNLLEMNDESGNGICVMGDPEKLDGKAEFEIAEATAKAKATLAGAPTDAVSRARDYLMSVFEDREAEIGDRMDALKLSRKCEAKKIAPQTVHVTRREEKDRKEAWREYEINQLQAEIVLATLDHPPPGWDSVLRRPDYLPPPGDEWPPTGRGPDGKLILFPDKKRG